MKFSIIMNERTNTNTFLYSDSGLIKLLPNNGILKKYYAPGSHANTNIIAHTFWKVIAFFSDTFDFTTNIGNSVSIKNG